MKIKVGPETDALYFRLDASPVIDSEEVRPGVVLDFNADDQVVGVEILRVQERVPLADLKQIQFEVALRVNSTWPGKGATPPCG